jgi:hypothetical protein
LTIAKKDRNMQRFTNLTAEEINQKRVEMTPKATKV